MRERERGSKRKIPEYVEPIWEDPDSRERSECRPMVGKLPPHVMMLLLIEGDNLSTVEWLNGKYAVDSKYLLPAVSRARRNMLSCWKTRATMPCRRNQ